jgi:cephalosporin hydroxylase
MPLISLKMRLGANKFCDIVSVGSYFIIEDGIINELGLENNMKEGSIIVREFLPNHPEL